MYIVSYQAGTSGTFIAGLLWNWILNDSKQFDFSNFGNSHSNVDFKFNWSTIPEPYNHWDTLYKHKIDPIDKSKPLILTTHLPPRYEQLEEMYRDAKIINITYTDADKGCIAANWFYKVILAQIVNADTKEKYDYSMWLWQYLKNETGLDKHITELTVEEAKRCITVWVNHKDSLLVPEQNIIDGVYFAPLRTGDTIIPYYDILTKKDKVLDQLSKTINLEITDWVSDTYDNYIQVQRKLFDEKAPWLSDYINV